MPPMICRRDARRDVYPDERVAAQSADEPIAAAPAVTTPDSSEAASAASDAQPEAAFARTLGRLAADAATQDYPAGALYVVATPIGNRSDITIRALACLARVDAIAAEDTRTARQLLQHYGIERPLIAAHRHNEHEAAAAVVARLAGGQRVACVTDAGTPGVSDPGARLVAAVRAAGHRVIPLPGASALTTAWSAAGLPEGPVRFEGFLPSKTMQATERLRALVAVDAHLVFYEAPHRIVETMDAIGAIFGDRSCVIARELTKRFETIHRDRASEIAAWLAADARRLRGEFVVIVEAAIVDEQTADRTLAAALPILDRLIAALPLSEAAALTAELTGVSRKALYAEALKRRPSTD